MEYVVFYKKKFSKYSFLERGWDMWWLGDASDVYHVIPVLNFQDFSGNNF